jgi:hypothetical protein
MRNKVRDLMDFATENRASVWIFGEIKGVTHQFDTKSNIFCPFSMHEYFKCKQTQHQTAAEYLETFRANVDLLELRTTLVKVTSSSTISAVH